MKEVRVFTPAIARRVDVFFIDIDNNNKPLQKLDMRKPYEPVEDELAYNPSFSISREEAILLHKALTEYFDRNAISLEKEDHLKGRMEATEKHLQEVSAINEGNMALITKLIGKL